ncbi:adenosylcobinamide-GDP ribazoletransferase [Maribius pontilimi]|uniref:Adenosylcobinamide-GDP ribazoletransferase n=2 Tax=Palleronia pontilimi TaxID=1964209 RepID=A0A934IFB8_9RHOB|nr:adenosylcobinamide-GDP ribazoletransferase [Palleronia pontilimi]
MATALTLLTRLPVRARFDRTAQAAWAWPLVGIVTGAVAAGLALVGLALNVPPSVLAGLVLAAQIVVTGAMHEDGLADCADGFWGGFDRARRLEIMRDSHLGTYGAIALILAIGLRWVVLVSILAQPAWLVLAALVSAGMLSRAAMLGVAAALLHARDDGLSRATGRPGKRTAAIGVGIAFGVSAMLLGQGIALALLLTGLVGLGVAALARRKIGGQTGDVLGATQQLAEIAALVALS